MTLRTKYQFLHVKPFHKKMHKRLSVDRSETLENMLIHTYTYKLIMIEKVLRANHSISSDQ